MLSRILLTVIMAAFTAVNLYSQTSPKPKSLIHYRVLMTSINIEDVQPDEISVSLNAFNTGRKPIDLSEFNSVPQEMEIKFEESFYRSSINGLENEIRTSLINKNIIIPNGKILRNIRFSLPCNESLYKQLTKKRSRYSKAYTPKKRNSKAAELKYKTTDKKLNPTPSLFAKSKKKKSNISPKDKTAEIATNTKTKTTNTNATAAPKKNSPEIPKVDDKKSAIDLDKERKSKEIAATESRELELKNKAIEARKMKDKEMAAIELRQKQKKELALKNKEIEAQKMKDKEMAKEEDIAIETSVIQKKEKLSIIERQKLKRQEREKAKQDEYEFEKASQKEDEKAILESLGVGNSNNKSKNDDGVAFDTRASVEASKNSYAEKEVCPDLILNNINVLKKNKNWVTIEYTLTNQGKGPAYLTKNKNGQGIALRAFLSSSEKISRGALPLGGGFVDYTKDNGLYPNSTFTGTIKLDIRKMTRFTPYVIINLDPFNVLQECDKTNNYGNVKVGN